MTTNDNAPNPIVRRIPLVADPGWVAREYRNGKWDAENTRGPGLTIGFDSFGELTAYLAEQRRERTSPSAVSRRLHALGFVVVASPSREGIRVKRSGFPGADALVVPDFDSERKRIESADDLAAALTEDGFSVRRSGTHLYVAR